MATGDWCAGKTKQTDVRVTKMAQNVSKSLRDPALRKRLDDQKRFSKQEILQKISSSNTDWSLSSDLSGYTKQSEKNILCTCSAGHQSCISLIDILNNVRCKTCHPKRNVGSLNPAYQKVDVFFDKLMTKFGHDAFRFDPTLYSGLYGQLEFECVKCRHVFIKAPRVLLNERYGCPQCANTGRGNKQRRTKEEFIAITQQNYGNQFIYEHKSGQKYGNTDTIIRTCTVCNTTQTQCIGNQLTGNGCSTCSQKKKHTKESFVAAAQRIWGIDSFDYSLVEYINNKQHVTIKCKAAGHVFLSSPSNHLSKRGCPHCSIKKFISVGETEWLDSLAIPKENRNMWINVNGQKFNVDALINSTIYEYYGDFWHGNPKKFDAEQINNFCGLTMGELHKHTITREELLREGGYVVMTMWESDWIELRKTRPRS